MRFITALYNKTLNQTIFNNVRIDADRKRTNLCESCSSAGCEARAESQNFSTIVFATLLGPDASST
jgi:hypothetical protein